MKKPFKCGITMKTLLTALLYTCFLCCSPLPAHNNQTQQCINSTILSLDKNSPAINETILDVLSIQKSLIVSSQKPIPEGFAKTGFLLIPMTPEYVFSLLEKKDGRIVCAYLDQTLVGYLILTETSQFTELYQDETVGRFETSIDAALLNGWVTGKGVGYIEQIGVKPGYSRLGIGSQLIAKSKLLKPQGLIADVFIHPVKNEASLQFFSYQGFEKAGILYQYPTAHATFPIAHQTQVIFWNLAPPEGL